VNGNVKLGRAAARSGEWAQHFSNASCFENELVRCDKLNGEVANILVTSYEDATRMLRGSYDETAAVVLSRNPARRTVERVNRVLV